MNLFRLLAFALTLIFLTSSSAFAIKVSKEAENDATPIAGCNKLPSSATIETMTVHDTANICHEMARVFEGIRNMDVTLFEETIFLLVVNKYDDDITQIAKELVEIIRLRGQFDKPDSWENTLNLVYRSWGDGGLIGPRQIIALLNAAGPKRAKSISDDALTLATIIAKRQYQKGD